MPDKKYPHIKVKLVGKDGNAFAIMGNCAEQMRKAKCTDEQIEEYMAESMSGDYNHLLNTAMKYFNVT